METTGGELKEALRSTERAEDIPSNHPLEEYSRISMCSFPTGQMPKATEYGLDDCNDDFVFTKNYEYLSVLYHI